MVIKYSSKLIENFENPKNIGKLKKYTVSEKGYNEKDGDEIEFFILLKDNIIVDVGYNVKGCPRIIASSSYTSVLVMGKSVSDVIKIDENIIRKDFSLEDPKFKCVSLPLKTIKKALKKIGN
jgi:nitrogen fixation NifU-like protein